MNNYDDFNEGIEKNSKKKGKGTIIICLLIICIFSTIGYLGHQNQKQQQYRSEIASEYITSYELKLNEITDQLNQVLDEKFAELEEEDAEYFEVLGEIINSYYPFKDELEEFRNSVVAESSSYYVSNETHYEMLLYIDNTLDEIDEALTKAVSEMKGSYVSILEHYTEDETLENLAKSIQNIESTIELLETSDWAVEFLTAEEYEELHTTAGTMLQSKESAIGKLISYKKAGDDGVICYSTTTQETAMLEKVNTLRKSNGLNTLSYDSNLFSIAKIRGIEITKLFSHTRPNGTDCLTVSVDMGGENISCNSEDFSIEASYKQFYDSIGHRENMLYANYTRFAANRVIANGCAYWVQIFGF